MADAIEKEKARRFASLFLLCINAGYGRRMARHVCRELNRDYGDRDYDERGEVGVI